MENTLGMKFVLIPAGNFMMGMGESAETLAQDFPQYDNQRIELLADETPTHPVKVTRDFFLGQHEVTVGQFRRFVEASGYAPESISDRTGAYGYNTNYDPSLTVRKDAFEGRSPQYSWQNPGFAQTDEHPVLNVTWNDAMAMARWLSQKEGATYRLPTEAEWEYACRAGSTDRYSHGQHPQALSSHANLFAAETAALWPQWQSYAMPDHDGHIFTAPVGSYPPNRFGLYDMVGNAWEWVADWYGERYYVQSPDHDPLGPSTGTEKVRRGGSWHTWPLYGRCSFRNWNTPQTRYVLLGMRLLREVSPDK